MFHWQIKEKMKICHMHFALRKSCFIYKEYRAVCLQAKPSWYHMATAVIIWMLWCTSTARVPRECSLSRNTLSGWHLNCTVWIWIPDCALHLQTVGFCAKKLSGDCSANHSVFELRDQCGEKKKENDMNKSTSVSVSLMLTTWIEPPCLLFVYSCYLDAHKTCHTHGSHWCQCELGPRGSTVFS